MKLTIAYVVVQLAAVVVVVLNIRPSVPVSAALSVVLTGALLAAWTEVSALRRPTRKDSAPDLVGLLESD